MLFLNPWMLLGLAGITIPIIIHLVRQQAAKPIDWGAMRFLFDTVVVRRRKMEWEDLLLMAARCLLLALVALAVARPFIPPDSTVPWLFLLPLALIGVALFGASFVIFSRKWRWLLRGAGFALLVLAAALVWMEKHLNLKRFEASDRRDVALVIDGSSSMEMRRGGKSVFEIAVDEAREVVRDAPRGTAFTVVLGGPAPEARTAEPLTHRADVLGVLDELKPVGGIFRAQEALGVATLGLAEGTNASKEIVVFTDDQRHGWRFDNPGSWDGLNGAWKALNSKPKLILRNFGAPPSFRNIALGGLDFSRVVIGTDREVGIRITVENRGDEAVTPGQIELEINGKSIGGKPIGLLVKAQSETVEFRHKFKEPGPAVVSARIAAKDDLTTDNRIERVVTVRKTLNVLLVDGNPSGGFFERAAGYTALALAPGKPGDQLMDPEVVAVTALTKEALIGRDVIVLADVARLPQSLATTVADRVAAGTGLMVIAGPRAEPAFYNNWSGPAGPLVPLPLGEESVDADGVKPAAATFIHESLALFRDGSDLDGALVRRWRKTGAAVDGAAQGGALANGDALFGARSYANGRTLLVTAALDARSGNLPAKRSFVPLIHEIVTWVAGGGVDLNVASSWSPSIRLGESRGGLSAIYMPRNDKRRRVLQERIDPAIDFDWKDGKPHKNMRGDDFVIDWRGKLVAPVSGSYRIIGKADDSLTVRIDGGPRMSAGGGRKDLGEVKLEAGKAVDFEAQYSEEKGNAQVKLSWVPPGLSEEVIPTSAFVPVIGDGGSVFEAVDPRGEPRTARLRMSGRGQELLIEGSAVPGIYELKIGEETSDWIPGWQGEMLPVAVTADPAESGYEVINEDDLDLIRVQNIDLIRPRSAADILAVLQGKGFGRGIWKWLALAGFAFFLIESVLARWVSKSRRSAEDVRWTLVKTRFGKEAADEIAGPIAGDLRRSLGHCVRALALRAAGVRLAVVGDRRGNRARGGSRHPSLSL